MIGELIKVHMILNKVSQASIMKQIGISKATLCRIERGQVCNQETTLKLIQWIFSQPLEKKKNKK